MADGFALAPVRQHAPGIYLDLPMLDYINDPAISGSGLKKLLTSPADFKWELPAIRNPLFTPPESDARALGTLCHAAVLEGMTVFDQRYFVAPEFDDDDPRVIRTADHAKAWLKDQGMKVSGLKAELFERIREAARDMTDEGAGEDEIPILIEEEIERLRAGREVIKRKAYDYVALVERTVRYWPDAQRLLAEGLSEISIFWVEDGVRYKARIDRLTARAVIDVKKFGQPPMRTRSLGTHLQYEAINYGYDIQAVHNHRAAMQIPLLLEAGAELVASGEDASARLAQLQQIAAAILAEPPVFHWLFLRTPGPPQGFIKPFPTGCKRWSHCGWEIDEALINLRRYRDQCGDELDPDKPWIEVGVEDWDDDVLPEYLWVMS